MTDPIARALREISNTLNALGAEGRLAKLSELREIAQDDDSGFTDWLIAITETGQVDLLGALVRPGK